MNDHRVLVIAGFGGERNGEPRREKIRTHVEPMAGAAADVTYLTLKPARVDASNVQVERIQPTRWWILDFLRLWIATIQHARTGRYDLIASFSLVPYGCFALTAKYASGIPAHLGIIGMDLDVHAEGPFGPLVQWAFRHFDAISIAGSSCRERLVGMGVPPDRIHTVLHPVRAEYADVARAESPQYDMVWVGRMSDEKAPDRFVEIVEALHIRGVAVDAAIIGDGPVYERIERMLASKGLQSAIELVGWHPQPAEFYRESRLYVITSEREMLPLTLIEAMLIGTVPVAPRIGAIPDLVSDGTNGYLVSDRDPDTYADAIATALEDPDRLEQIGERATGVEDDVSMEAVAASWRSLFGAMREDGQSVDTPTVAETSA